jgi:hypothetical protein
MLENLLPNKNMREFEDATLTFIRRLANKATTRNYGGSNESLSV